jgi:hypothetical protein
MKKVINGDYGLGGNSPIFREGDEVFARVIAVGTCEENGVAKRSLEAAYDHSPVVLRTGASSIATPTCSSISDDEIQVCGENPTQMEITNTLSCGTTLRTTTWLVTTESTFSLKPTPLVTSATTTELMP